MKKQFIFVFAILLMAAFTFTSCDCKKEEACEETCCQAVSVDSLVGLWNNAWNTKNMDALKGMIADSAFVMDHEWHITGKDSIFAKWITPSLPVISNVKTIPLKTTSCCCCVNLTGLYTLDYTNDKGEVIPSKGNFTFTWVMQDDKTYKIEMMHMTEFHEKGSK